MSKTRIRPEPPPAPPDPERDREMEKLHERAINAELAYEQLSAKKPYDTYWSRRALTAEGQLRNERAKVEIFVGVIRRFGACDWNAGDWEELKASLVLVK